MKLYPLLFALVIAFAACSNSDIQYRSGPPGQDGAPGADGRDGQDGRDGVDGRAGADGAAGRDGLDGRDSTPVTVVKFCGKSDDKDFPEVGLCIGGVLYAVYSDKTAWLTRIVPGVYTTTTNGTNCTFVVTEDACL